jgi:WD40 repeat protein/serine/threonine protein kinase
MKKELKKFLSTVLLLPQLLSACNYSSVESLGMQSHSSKGYNQANSSVTTGTDSDKLDIAKVCANDNRSKAQCLSYGISYIRTYLHKYSENNPQRYFPSQEYKEHSEMTLSFLKTKFHGDKIDYKVLVYYLNLLQVYEHTINNLGIADIHAEIIAKVFLDGKGNPLDLNWMVLRKLISFDLKENNQDGLIRKLGLIGECEAAHFDRLLIEGFQKKIEEALEYIDIRGNCEDPAIAFAKRKLCELQSRISEGMDGKRKQELLESIKCGRLEKYLPIKKRNYKIEYGFSETYTAILGDDGGLYLLLNSLKEKDAEEVAKYHLGENYVQQKIESTLDFQREQIYKYKIDGGEVRWEYEKSLNLEAKNLIIGQGGYGKVRLGISLFKSSTMPGDVICIKKTKSVNITNAYVYTEPSKILEQVFNEYIKTNLSTVDGIFAPCILDMAAVLYQPNMRTLEAKQLTATRNKIPQEYHQKGYLMMELIPKESAKDIFMKPIYQKWVYQKQYLIDVFSSANYLLEKHNVFVSDLKPDNTLFDTRKNQAAIIDLAGSLSVNSDEITLGLLSLLKVEYTADYIAPELFAVSEASDYKKKISLKKALSYMCGRVMDKIINFAALKNEVATGISLKENDLGRITRLINELTGLEGVNKRETIAASILESANKNPKNFCETKKLITELGLNEDSIKSRKDLFDAIQELKGIGDDREVTTLFVQSYIDFLKKSSFFRGLEYSYEQLYSPLAFMDVDPEEYCGAETINETKMMEPLHHASSYTLLLLGNAGSGKSTFIKREFCEAVRRWEPQAHIPVYINLAENTDIDKAFKAIDSILDTNVGSGSDGYIKFKNLPIQLYLDSLDEGVGMTSRGESEHSSNKVELLLKSYADNLGYEKLKIFITCRTEYVKKHNYASWFKINNRDFSKYYIMPANYNPRSSFEKPYDIREEYIESEEMIDDEEIMDRMFDRCRCGNLFQDLPWQFCYLELWCGKNSKDLGIYSKIIGDLEFYKDIDTPYILGTTLDLIARLHNADTTTQIFGEKSCSVTDLKALLSRSKLSKPDIYDGYIDFGLEKKICDKNFTPEQKKIVYRYLKCDESGIKKSLENICKNIAAVLHLKNSFKLTSDSELFKYFEHDDEVPFNHQLLSLIVELLPLKLNIQDTRRTFSKHVIKQNVEISFEHDIIKNYFLLKAIEDELADENFVSSDLLGCRSITNDIELVRFIRDYLDGKNGLNLRTRLIELVNKSPRGSENGAIKSDAALANAMTLLVAAGHSFSGANLSGLSLKDANLRGGVLSGAYFIESDLSGVDFTNAYISEADFSGATMNNAVFPSVLNLGNKIKKVESLSLSYDSRFVAIMDDCYEITIYDLNNKKLFQSWNCDDKLWHNYKLLFGNKSNLLVLFSWLDECKSKIKVATLNDKQDKFNELYYILTRNTSVPLIEYDNDDRYGAVALSRDDKFVAVGSSQNGTIRIWTIDEGKLFKTISIDPVINTTAYFEDAKQRLPYNREVKALDFSDCGRYLVSAGTDILDRNRAYDKHRILVWDLFNKEQYLADTCVEEKAYDFISKSKNHSDEITCVKFLENKNKLLSSSLDQTIKVWNLKGEPKLLRTINVGDSVYDLKISNLSPGLVIVSTIFDVRVIDYNCGEVKNVAAHHLDKLKWHCMDYSGEKGFAVSAGYDETIKIYDVFKTSGAPCYKKFANKLTLNFLKCILSPTNSNEFASIHKAEKNIDLFIGLWHLEPAPKMVHKLYATDPKLNIFSDLYSRVDLITDINYSFDGKLLVSSSEDKTVRVWSISPEGGILLQSLDGHENSVKSVVFTSDNKFVVSIDEKNIILKWKIDEERASSFYTLTNKFNMNELHNLERAICALNCKYIVSANCNGVTGGKSEIKIWDVLGTSQDLHLRKTISFNGKNQSIHKIILTTDYLLLMTTQSSKLFKIETSEDLCKKNDINQLIKESIPVSAIASSPDGKYILIESNDLSLNMIDVEEAKVKLQLLANASYLSSINYSADGKSLITASWGGAINIWKMVEEKSSQHDVIKWQLIHNITNLEPRFFARRAKISSVVGLSERDIEVLEQNGAIVEKIGNRMEEEGNLGNIFEEDSINPIRRAK